MVDKQVKAMPPLDEDSRLAMPLQEFCGRIGIGRNTGYKAARNGEIPTLRFGKKILVTLKTARVLLAAGDVA